MAEKGNPMRCCMIVYAIYPLGETRVQREAEILVQHGYAVDVICLRLPGDLPIDSYKNVRIYRQKYRFPILGGRSAGLKGRFFNYLRFFLTAGIRVTLLHLKKRYDVVQVHNLPDFLVFCAFIPKLLGASVILDLHDLMPEFFAGHYKTKTQFLPNLINLQERLSCKFADHVITVSEHWRQALIKRGVPEQKCSVVMNVADDKIFRPREDGDSHPPQPNQFRLIYHGSIHERYGLDLLVEAVDQLRNKIPNIHLLLVGRGDFLTRIIQIVEEHGLTQYVSIKGLCLAEELPDIIQSCQLGVVPYRNDVFTDGLLPTKLMEYAALGLPAVASRTTAIQAYFTDTNTEFFEPGNADDLAKHILSLYENPDRMAEYAHNSQNFNKRYNWAKVGAEYVDLVQKLGQGKIQVREKSSTLI